MIQGKLLSYGSSLEEAFYIRKSVFVDELGISYEDEFDDADQEAIHVIVYDTISEQAGTDTDYNKKKSVATGRIVLDGDICIISHIAVLKEFRNKAYGDFTTRMLINKAFTSGIKEVILDCSPQTVGFFQNIGFKIIQTFENSNNDTIHRMIINTNDTKKICQKCIK